MKALRFAEFGPPSVLRIEEVPIPDPAQGKRWFAWRPQRSIPATSGMSRGDSRKQPCREPPAGTLRVLYGWRLRGYERSLAASHPVTASEEISSTPAH